MTTSNGSYDIVLSNGRVIDPETGLDAVRNVGIKGGKIAAVTENPIQNSPGRRRSPRGAIPKTISEV